MKKKFLNLILFFAFLNYSNKKDDPVKEKEEMIEEVLFKEIRKSNRKK